MEYVGTKRSNRVQKRTAEACDCGAHQGDGHDSNHDAERGKHRAQFIGLDRIPCDDQPFDQFSEVCHANFSSMADVRCISFKSRRLNGLITGDQAVSNTYHSPGAQSDFFLMGDHDNGVSAF